MPTISIYLKNEDYEKWQAIKKKSEWLHEKLNAGSEDAGSVLPVSELPEGLKKVVTPVTRGRTGSFTELFGGLCKHGAAPGFCKDRKCENTQFKKGKQ